MRRGDQHQPFLFTREVRERRCQQAQLADPLLVGEQLSQRGARPAATWQLRIQLGKAGRNTFDRDLGVLIPAPDGGMLQNKIEGKRHDDGRNPG
jgi:hypothetical protein